MSNLSDDELERFISGLILHAIILGGFERVMSLMKKAVNNEEFWKAEAKVLGIVNEAQESIKNILARKEAGMS